MIPVSLLHHLAFPLLFIGNFVFHHRPEWVIWLPAGRATYVLAILLPFGVVLPGLALGSLARREGKSLRDFGAALTGRDVLMAAAAFGLGVFCAAFPIGRKVLDDPDGLRKAGHLFVRLFPASMAEALVFCGCLQKAVEAVVEKKLSSCPSCLRAFVVNDRLRAVVAGIVVSAVAFGLFHFSYPPPWDTWGKVLTLIPVWTGVAAVYAATRSLAAAVVFDNVMAVVGFKLNGLSLPGPAALGLGLDVVVIVAAVVAVAAGRRTPAGHPASPA